MSFTSSAFKFNCIIALTSIKEFSEFICSNNLMTMQKLRIFYKEYIIDNDALLIDSEPFCQKAEIDVLKE